MNLKLVGFVALCGAFAVACGDTSSSGGGGSTAANNNGGDNNNGGGGSTSVVQPGSGGTINIGGSGQGGTSGVPACYDETAAATITADMSAVGLDQCTPQQVDDFLTNCFAPGTADTCMTYLTANAGCGGCILGVDDPNAATPMPTGNIPPILNGNTYAYVQLNACEAAVQGLPQCAAPLTNLIFCAQLTCEVNCSNDAGSTEFDDCVNYSASEGLCAQTVTIPAECDPILQLTALDPECGGDGMDFASLYTAVANYFCGPPG